jgi:hypothetical protein
MGQAQQAARQNKPKSAKAKSKRINIPKPQQTRIKARYVQGQSVRQIAREEKRDRATVQKVISSEEMVDYISKKQSELLTFADPALESLLYTLENETDGEKAVLVLDRLEVFPRPETKRLDVDINATQILDNQPETEDEKLERAVKAECAKLAFISYERHKVFRTPMPEMEEITEEESKLKGK